jgi:hypothetical protein
MTKETQDSKGCGKTRIIVIANEVKQSTSIEGLLRHFIPRNDMQGCFQQPVKI